VGVSREKMGSGEWGVVLDGQNRTYGSPRGGPLPTPHSTHTGSDVALRLPCSVPYAPMTRRTPLARLGLLTLATLQLLITGAAAWADARLDAGGPKGPIHVESHATSACAPVHPADCILHVSLHARPSRPAPRGGARPQRRPVCGACVSRSSSLRSSAAPPRHPRSAALLTRSRVPRDSRSRSIRRATAPREVRSRASHCYQESSCLSPIRAASLRRSRS
jgi:hypothetical protein